MNSKHNNLINKGKSGGSINYNKKNIKRDTRIRDVFVCLCVCVWKGREDNWVGGLVFMIRGLRMITKSF